MAGNNNGTQNLEAILRSLRAYQPQQQAPAPVPAQSNVYGQQNPVSGAPSSNAQTSYDYNNATPAAQHALPYQPPPSNPYVPERPYDPSAVLQQHATTPSSRSSYTPPPIDPATITDWKGGLRCVTTVAERNPGFKAAIRRMIADQEKNEQDWWNGRQNLVKNQATRSKQSPTSEDKQNISTQSRDELRAYDFKVHKAQSQMVDAMSKELKDLGVPFFGVPSYMVKSKGEDGPTVGNGGPISMDELSGLQRRMIEHLEMLYRVD